MSSRTCYIGIGSNLGDRLEMMHRAVNLLCNDRSCDVRRVSGIYNTEPWGMKHQPPYLNAVVEIATNETPELVYALCKYIEETLGRKSTQKYFPRLIDLDILFYGSERLRFSDVVIPHPRLQDRRFVLIPMHDLAPAFVHPELHKSIEALLDECRDVGAVTKTDYHLAVSRNV